MRRKISHAKEFQIIYVEYSILKGKQHKSPLLKHGLHVLKSFQKESMERTIKNNLTELPWWLSGKESACQCRRCGFDP